MRDMASRLVDLADAATDREPHEPDLLEALEPKSEAEADPRASDGGENDSAAPTVELKGAADSSARKAPEKIAGNGQSKQGVKTRRRS
jgi:hypothetical protein